MRCRVPLFLIGLFFFVLGTFTTILSWSTSLQQRTFQFILEETFAVIVLGLGVALIGIAMIYYVLGLVRRHSFYLWTGPLSVAVDDTVMYQYLEDYWQRRFPEDKIPFQVTFKKYACRVAAELPAIPRVEQKPLVNQIKEDFRDLFGRKIGYPYDVQIAAYFKRSTL